MRLITEIITMTKHTFLFLTLILLVFLCRGSLSQLRDDEHECDSAQHRCWYIEYVSVRTTTTRRPWWCLFLCRREYSEYRLVKQKTCECCPGWTMQGGNCAECETGHYGIHCAKTCSCDGGGYKCDRIYGCVSEQLDDRNCTLVASDSGVCPDCGGECINGQRCNHTTNVCECPPGWRDDSGGICNFYAGCPDGKYGVDCDKQCQCENNATCDVLTGHCDCPAGWMGLNCSNSCGPSKYGRNCTKTCICPDNALECNRIDGSCLCPPGFYGMNCSVECPDGYYGSNCRHNCSCDEQIETCNPINGTCIIKEAGLPTPTLGSEPDDPGGLSSSVTGAVIGGVIAGIFVCVLIVSLLFIRRRRKQATKKRTDDNLPISPEVHYENAKDVNEECTELEGKHHHDNSYAMAFQSPPQHFNVGGATYAMSNPHAQREASDEFIDPTEEYSHLDRALAKSPKTIPDECNDYNALGATAADSDGQYSHLDRGQWSGSVRSAEDCGAVLQPVEQGGEYSNLDSKGRRSQDHGNQYEVVAVE
ncbi:multiple epidermal growth factor-like domains protein 10 [Patiria miniata]|uniref:EGF-like domain-containing protein n=1 Tax=Patiria miniata TaxID=46514 RepID=A0A914BT01_PATMI|nr:multiple epidermal growth factor-like domains protein 10 [Patiria miniata]